MLLIITISTFVCITFGVIGLYWLISRPQSAATERLRKMNEGGASMQAASVSIMQEESAASDFAERIATPLNRLVPVSAVEAHKLQKKLMQAGYRNRNAPIIYRAIQLTSMIGYPCLVALSCALLARPFGSAFIFIMLAFGKGFIMPRYLLGRMIRNRQQRVRWGLADALDLMVVSIEAGLGLNASMLRISEELRDVHPDIRVGREREEALRNLAERTGVDDLRSLVAMLIQADRFGTSIARAVRVYADSLRTKRRQRAEQAAQKAAVKLLLP